MRRIVQGGLLLWMCGAILGGVSAQAQSGSAEQKAIRAVLDAQVAAWNRGDVEGFMAGYWKSDETLFAGANGFSRGWQALLDRYRKNYPDRKAMGKLSFSDLEIHVLSKDAAYIVGQWQLERESDRPGGVFTLIARRFPEGWRIVHDHTSAFAATKKD
jgi:ketosteroid isomerase-like protein